MSVQTIHLKDLQPDSRQMVLGAAEKHELDILERLLEKTRHDGPDGEVIRSWFEASVLGLVVEVLREAERDETA